MASKMLSFEGMTRPLLLREGHSTATRVARRLLSLLIFAFLVGRLQGAGLVAGWPYDAAQASVPYGLTNATAVAAGDMGVIALRDDRTVVTWNYPSWAPLQTLSNVVAIAAGSWHALALLSDGKVVAAGDSSIESTNVPPDLSGVVAIAAGNFHNLALRSDGVVVAWGENGSGQTNVLAIQPRCHPVEPGTSIELHARAVGAQPMSYQWLFNDQWIAGATNADLALHEVRWADTGSYRLVASNAQGSVTSTVARVEFLAGPALSQALGEPAANWQNGSTNAAWFGQGEVHHDSDAAARSGRIGNRKSSVLETSVVGPGTLSFWWRVSCEEGYDFLRFLVDDQPANTAPKLTGEVDWQEQVIPVSAGRHTLRWIYEKDASVAVGEDAGWVDEVRFLPDPPVISLSPLPQRVGVGAAVGFRVVATGSPPLTFQWRHDGLELAGATNSTLVLSKVSRRDRGVYSVTVENPGGQVLSPNATLEVRVPQFLEIDPIAAEARFELHSIDVDGGGPMLEDLGDLEVQVSTNLMDWLKLSSGLALTNGRVRILDPSAATAPFQFYRVLER